MNPNSQKQIRELTPRLRDYKTTAALGELNSLSKTTLYTSSVISNEVDIKFKEWQSEKTISFAADLLNSAIIVNDINTAKQASDFILSSKENVNSSLINLAKSILSADTNVKQDRTMLNNEILRKSISEYKIKLKKYPQNAIGWCELARLYTFIKQYDKAELALKKALILSPNNRFILRTAIGFYTHLNDPEIAKFVLNKSILLPSDPWLIANDIVLSDILDYRSKYIRDGKRHIESNNFSNKNLTELSSALATIELTKGSMKKAKKLYSISLKDPTDNTLAQAMWAKDRSKNIIENEHIEKIDIPFDFEAKFYVYRQTGELDKSLIEIDRWINDQTFSKDPYSWGSYVASVGLRKYNVAIKILHKGLEFNPNDFTILNNLVFSYANLGDINQMNYYYNKLTNVYNNDKAGDNDVVFFATSGLFFYKSGNIELGRKGYESSIKISKEKNNKNAEILAKIYLAKEEFLQNTDEKYKFFDDAIKLSEYISEIEIVNEINYLRTLFNR